VLEFWGQFAVLEGGKVEEGVLFTFSSEGKVLEAKAGIARADAQKRHAYCYPDGLLVPAFLNMHLHLEYSYAHGQFEAGQGSVAFIQFMRTLPFPSAYEVIRNASSSFQQAFSRGTQYFCDTENLLTLISFKNTFSSHFLTFYEIFGLNQHDFDKMVSRISRIPFSHPLFPTPHSFYALSEPLWEGFHQWLETLATAFLSLHFLESDEERELLEKGKGPLMDYFQTFATWPYPPQPPIDWLLSHIPKHFRLLLVHNTVMEKEEIRKVATEYPNLYFCLCPRSNFFITGKIPPIQWFLEEVPDRVVLGTDSLVSNSSLHVWDEITFLVERGIKLSFSDLSRLLWVNPTRFLFGIEEPFRPGFSPGLVLIQGDWERLTPTETKLLLPARYSQVGKLPYL